MSTSPNTPEEYVEAWTKMNEELLEDGCPLFIDIPTIEKIQHWMERNND